MTIRDTNLDKSSFNEVLVAQITPMFQANFSYNNNARLVNTAVTGSGTITNATALAKCNTTAAASSSATLTSVAALDYRGGQGGLFRGTAVFTTGVAGSEQIVGIGDSVNGFFFGYNGATFGILHRVNSVDTWYPQTSWNTMKMTSGEPNSMTLDPTKGNVYEIQLQYLGFGQIVFSVENSSTGAFDTVHIIRFANTSATPSLYNPHLPACVVAENTSNTSAITVATASLMLGIEGMLHDDIMPYYAKDNAFSYTTSGFKNALTIRNKTSFQGKTNYIPLHLDGISIATDGTKNVEVEIIIDATLGGTPSYTDISTNTSVVDFDTAGTTASGTVGLIAELAKSDSQRITPVRQILIYPGQTLTVAVKSDAASSVDVGINWTERH